MSTQQLPEDQVQGFPNEDDLPMSAICGASICTSYGKSIGTALDSIVVAPSSLPSQRPKSDGGRGGIDTNDITGIVTSSDFLIQFPSQPLRTERDIDEYTIILQINGNNIEESFLSMSLPKAKGKAASSRTSGSSMCNFRDGNSTKPSTDILQELVKRRILNFGRNLIRYILIRRPSEKSEKKSDGRNPNQQLHDAIGTADAFVFLWSVHDKIVISDIDGTLTKSDVRGVIDSMLTEKYVHVHKGVCSFFSELVKEQGNEHNGGREGGEKGQVRVLYLSSRPMKFIHSTRKFLSMLSQVQDDDEPQSQSEDAGTGRTFMPFMPCFIGQDSSMENEDDEQHPCQSPISDDLRDLSAVGLPPGPVLLHTGTLSTVLVNELVKKSTHKFKADTLARQVVLPFVAAGKETSGSRLFLAGFGNKKTDSMAYEMVGLNSHDIYIIDKKSILVSTTKDTQAICDSNGKGGEGNSQHGSVGVDGGLGCGAWDNVPVVGRESTGGLCSENVSVYSSSTSSNLKLSTRTFQGYTDPLLKKELLQRINTTISV